MSLNQDFLNDTDTVNLKSSLARIELLLTPRMRKNIPFFVHSEIKLNSVGS